jgi:hypothetical protein
MIQAFFYFGTLNAIEVKAKNNEDTILPITFKIDLKL